jgi:hypothetical protein
MLSVDANVCNRAYELWPVSTGRPRVPA